MKRNNVICAVHHLLLAIDDFNDWIRDHRGSVGDKLFTGYNKKIEWILNDLKVHPGFPDVVREGFKREMQSDVEMIPAIHERIAMLPPEKREAAITMLDQMIEQHRQEFQQSIKQKI